MSQVILRPVISEKSLRLAGLGQFTFMVDPRATASVIRQAIQDHYKVAVINLQVSNRRGSRRIFRQHAGTTTRTKRAIVRLAKGQSIPGFSVETKQKDSKTKGQKDGKSEVRSQKSEQTDELVTKSEAEAK